MNATARRGPARHRRWLAATVMLVVALGVGHLIAVATAPALHDRMLPWVLGRGLGLASYVALGAMVASGIWIGHPWRSRWAWPAPAVLLRAHAALGAATVALIAGHIASLVLDPYAGVSLTGALVPGHAVYRPLGVALGTVALYLMLLIVVTAALAGSVARRVWLQAHRLALAVFAFAWAHGVLTGSDTRALRWVYVASGALIGVLIVTRFASRLRVPAAGPSPAP